YSGPDSFSYTMTDGFGKTSTATVNLNVVITLTSIAISPSSASLTNGQMQQFSAVGYDQANNPMNPQPTFTWSIVSGTGTLTPRGAIDATATFTLGQNTEDVVIKAASGSVSGTATIHVVSSVGPSITSGPTASPSPITGTTTNLSVLATDVGGEPN